tara:strand:- start:955 stop:1515 length:561 start_codon:yes stop_codon:yes gene_type:complete
MPEYSFEIIAIDNCSTDSTFEILRAFAVKDKRLKLIKNTRNFGHIRSPFHGIISSTGAATIHLAADLQGSPEKFIEFVEWWEKGYKIVLGIKNKSKTYKSFYKLRTLYYASLKRIAEAPMISNITGFGFYDKTAIDKLRKSHDPYPFLRTIFLATRGNLHMDQSSNVAQGFFNHKFFFNLDHISCR